jgi:hypothetical protein
VFENRVLRRPRMRVRGGEKAAQWRASWFVFLAGMWMK